MSWRLRLRCAYNRKTMSRAQVVCLSVTVLLAHPVGVIRSRGLEDAGFVGLLAVAGSKCENDGALIINHSHEFRSAARDVSETGSQIRLVTLAPGGDKEYDDHRQVNAGLRP